MQRGTGAADLILAAMRAAGRGDDPWLLLEEAVWRVQIASSRLQRAVNLWKQGQHEAAIALASAALEILGGVPDELG